MTVSSALVPLPVGDAVDHIELPAFGVHPSTRHVLDRAAALAINAAIATERPLLVRGEPGTGKSQLARAAAVRLGRDFLLHSVDARTETRDLLYTVDAVSRLALAQLAGARGVVRSKAIDDLAVMNFVHPGALWWAYDRKTAHEQAVVASAPKLLTDGVEGRGVVLLIDEIDKADPSVPNGLLDTFGNGRFSVEGRRDVVAGSPRPLVLITTNEERALPDAFVRRCLVLHIELPKLPEKRDAFIAALVLRGSANVPSASDTVLNTAAGLIADERIELTKHAVCLPGVAEYVDLLRAVTSLADGEAAQIALLREIKALATRKHPLERST